MERAEIIQELRKYAHPSWYQQLLNKDTPTLKALLAYYKNGGVQTPDFAQGEPLKNKFIFKKYVWKN